jgi:hypothetical protein
MVSDIGGGMMGTVTYYYFCKKCGKETVGTSNQVSQCSNCGDKNIHFVGHTGEMSTTAISATIGKLMRTWSPPKLNKRWSWKRKL